jgi:hypothetical protein
MKKFCIAFWLILSSAMILAQQQGIIDNRDEIRTLFGRNRSNGGYGALSMMYSNIGGENALVLGAHGSWVINHGFALGLGGNGFINEAHFDATLNENVCLAGGYGGLIFEPIIAPRFPVHLSIPILLGIGGVAYSVTDYESFDYSGASYVEDTGVFLVAEPGIEVELNLLKYFRLALGGYYRYTSDMSLMNTEKDALNGLSFGLALKFGRF